MQYYTVEEAAFALNVTPRTVRNMINRGSFPHSFRLDPTNNRSPFRIIEDDLRNILELRGLLHLYDAQLILKDEPESIVQTMMGK